MSSELAVTENNVVALHSPMDMPIEQFKAGLEQREANRQALLQWIAKTLVEGVDFGIIRNKKSLWKPGAEKITGMLGIKREYPGFDKYQDAAVEGKSIDQIVIKCVLKNGQNVHVSEGLGGRTVRQEGGDLNKALKMAAKSSFIDGTLNLVGLSEIFTLDLEDMFPEELQTPSKPPEKKEEKKPAPKKVPMEFDPTPEERLKAYIGSINDEEFANQARRMTQEISDLKALKTLWMEFRDARDKGDITESEFKQIDTIKDLMKEILK
jgi:hypothetical protein